MRNFIWCVNHLVSVVGNYVGKVDIKMSDKMVIRLGTQKAMLYNGVWPADCYPIGVVIDADNQMGALVLLSNGIYIQLNSEVSHALNQAEVIECLRNL